jgi:tRNA dimethylallyltransferase
MKNIRKVIAVVGPTASGKTGLGVAIAEKYNGEIISADSRQVFRGLDIGTGKDLSEYGDIKYHLIDICDPGEKFTMFDWLEKAKIIIEDIFSRGKLPVIVGGTGLYVQSLVEGFTLNKVKSEKLKVKSYTREELNPKMLKELQGIFYKLQTDSYEPTASDLQNPRRLIRAIEKVQEGSEPAKVKPDFKTLQIAFDFPREELYQRIDQRVEEWFSQGFRKEIERLLESGATIEWLNTIGLEYKILANYLTDEPGREGGSFEQMKQMMKYKIHQYARRQLTWWRRFSEVVWTKNKKEAFGVIDDFLRK